MGALVARAQIAGGGGLPASAAAGVVSKRISMRAGGGRRIHGRGRQRRGRQACQTAEPLRIATVAMTVHEAPTGSAPVEGGAER